MPLTHCRSQRAGRLRSQRHRRRLSRVQLRTGRRRRLRLLRSALAARRRFRRVSVVRALVGSVRLLFDLVQPVADLVTYSPITRKTCDYYEISEAQVDLLLN